ncbi:MAG TPA: class F sortase [Dehalococcoidia bacterium]|nr:class F sortase [Dehalococcoidia bacterium]
MKTILKLPFLILTLPFRAGGDNTPAGERRPRRLRRLMVITGSIGLIAGLLVLGYGAYQMMTGDSEHKPGSGITTLNFGDVTGGVYDRPVVTSAPTPSPAPPLAAAPPPPPPLRDAPYRIRMPKVGIDAQVVTYGLDAKSVPEVPTNGAEVAWYNFAARPGTGSNAVFAGHVTWNGHAVFWNLDKMAPGDDIYLEGTDGTKVSYKVSDVFLVDANDPNALSVMDPTASDTMTVITCGGDFFYVGGIAQYDYTHRLIVRAALTGIQPGSGGVAAGG